MVRTADNGGILDRENGEFGTSDSRAAAVQSV